MEMVTVKISFFCKPKRPPAKIHFKINYNIYLKIGFKKDKNSNNRSVPYGLENRRYNIPMQKADEEKMAPRKYLVISLLFVARSAFIARVACHQKNSPF